MNAHQERTHFTAAQVFALTGVRQERQYQWDARGVTVPSRQDFRPDGSGTLSLKSLASVYQIAITAELVKLRVPAKQAAYASRLFTERQAAKLFPRGKTLIVLRTTGPALVNVEIDADFSALSDHGAAFVALDVNSVVKKVDDLLQTIKD
jgi:hypothetical protein